MFPAVDVPDGPFEDSSAATFKRTSVTERMNLEFRTEFFNVLTRANFGSPCQQCV